MFISQISQVKINQYNWAEKTLNRNWQNNKNTIVAIYVILLLENTNERKCVTDAVQLGNSIWLT